MKSFLSLSSLPRQDVAELVQLAQRLEKVPESDAAKGKVLGLLFMNPSLRTLSSFQSAMARLGGSSFVISPGQGTWSLDWEDGSVMSGQHAEHYREAIPVLASYSDVLGIRMFATGTDLDADLADSQFAKAAQICPVPLINMESAIDHPCQALADWKTLDDLGVSTNDKFVLSWANHPKALPLAVATATLKMAAQRGMQVTVLRPKEYALPNSVMNDASVLAQASGGSVRETEHVDEAMQGARVVYAKSWASSAFYGDAHQEEQIRNNLNGWCVDASWFRSADPSCTLMHCLPVRRNVVVSADVLDSARSSVVAQARNRMYAQMAVLHKLLC